MSRTSIATYAFPDADGVAPASFTDLSGGSGQVRCIGNKYHNGFSSNASDSRWSGAGTFTNDQYAKAVVSGFVHGTNGDWIGVIARASTDTGAGRDMYRSYVTDAATFVLTLEKVVNGSVTSLGTNTASAWANGDTVEIECIGTTINALRNGTVIITVTDSALTTGKPGICAFVGLNDALRGDDWEGGNIDSSSAVFGVVEDLQQRITYGFAA